MPGRVIAITGAFGVLGSAVAKAAAAEGARLALIDFAPSGRSIDGALVLPGVDLTNAVQAGAALNFLQGEAAARINARDFCRFTGIQ